MPSHGDLTAWARQGVLLLNATLTVQANAAGSHQKKGWELFTDKIISTVSDEKEGVVFLLWGNYAKAKQARIKETKNMILTTANPSPFLPHYVFFECRLFSKPNNYFASL